ncbi:hypothetical protein K0M31_002127 [Melipona bicolor]|uniref:Uncharacterized protein n=1 Tax=Melipona bicolor TaxID=60889 RepID=A0AA40KY88_9HYME|nr:hypothetical protein K0M31_002127 [Melipona bicolor]
MAAEEEEEEEEENERNEDGDEKLNERPRTQRSREREKRPPPLQGALTVRKYRAHHVAECTVEGDLDDPWYPRQPYDEEEAEEAGRGRKRGRGRREGGQDERERNKSPSWRTEEKGKPSREARPVGQRGRRIARERTRIKRNGARADEGEGRGGSTLKRRTFPHEPPKMRPGIVGPEPPMPRS